MDKDVDRSPLSWPLRITEIEEAAGARIEATRSEMAAIACLLDLKALNGLSFDYRLRRGSGARLHLTGRLKAHVTQTCVVSLEPVEASFDVPFEVEFWPAHLIEELGRQTEDPGSPGLFDWPEAIIDGTIDLGPIVYETLATALDPYPKREGASFEWSQQGSQTEGRESGPFAALKQLKGR
jgi:uncharacterized metal-binding protein YceD (DUF177 family)